MTLIAGIRCLDGYIIAADTAITSGSNVHQGRKLGHFQSTLGESYRIIIAGCGSMAYARMATEKIRDAIESLAVRTVLEMKQRVEEVLRDIYISHIGALYWQHGNGTGEPEFSLILGLETASEYGIFRTDRTAVFEIDQCSFAGTGEELANFLAEKYLIERKTMRVQLSTTATVQLTKHIFKAAKKSSANVGGNTEILARIIARDRANPCSDQLYALPVQNALDQQYLWGIDELVAHGLRTSLHPHSTRADVTNVSNKIFIALTNILESAQKMRLTPGMTGRCMHLVELDDTTWSANFSDHAD